MNRSNKLIIAIVVVILLGIATGIAIAASNSKENRANSVSNTSTSKSKDYSGKVVCLPKKGDGPHTMECAYGIQTDDGKYYAVVERDQTQAPGRITAQPIDSRVTVTGTLAPAGNEHEQYDIAGVVTITAIRTE